MTPAQRTIAFFCAMSLTIGISKLNFNYPEYANNEWAYFFIGFGIILLFAFVVSKIKNNF